MTDRELADCPLLPCPWCGSAPLVLHYSWAGRHGVACNNDACAATMEMTGATEAEAVAAWNRRAPSPSLLSRPDGGDARDAARYRWLRENCDVIEAMDETLIGWTFKNNGVTKLDDRIDAWMRQRAAIATEAKP